MAELFETIAQIKDNISAKERACHRKAKMIFKMRKDGHDVKQEERKLFNLIDAMETATISYLHYTKK